MENKTIDLSIFKKANGFIPTKTDSYSGDYNYGTSSRTKHYTDKDIEDILASGSALSLQQLSRSFFNKDSFYSRLIWYYATVINYNGILIPNPSYGKKMTLQSIQKRYTNALNFIESVELQDLFTKFTLRALIDGCYYGVLLNVDKTHLVVLDLPFAYCRSRFKDNNGNDIVEFNVTYFDTILDISIKNQALKTYPKCVSQYYARYKKSTKNLSKWFQIPSDIGLCFSINESGTPLFVSVIPSMRQYGNAVKLEQTKEAEEIRKIIIQKMPHLNTGELVFEPDEAFEMHEGAVNMLKGNTNLSVLTTYADVDSIVSKGSTENAVNVLDQMRQNIYSNAGASPQIFAPTGSQALPSSIKNDIALIMVLANKYNNFITTVLNDLFANGNVSFTYQILPVGIYNQIEYVDETLKLGENGYSSLIPSVAMGINQQELINLKSLENDVLKMEKVLIPLATSYTQSNKVEGQTGRPALSLEKKSEKTIKNEEAIDNTGGA